MNSPASSDESLAPIPLAPNPHETKGFQRRGPYVVVRCLGSRPKPAWSSQIKPLEQQRSLGSASPSVPALMSRADVGLSATRALLRGQRPLREPTHHLHGLVGGGLCAVRCTGRPPVLRRRTRPSLGQRRNTAAAPRPKRLSCLG